MCRTGELLFAHGCVGINTTGFGNHWLELKQLQQSSQLPGKHNPFPVLWICPTRTNVRRQPGPEEWYCNSKVANRLRAKNNEKQPKKNLPKSPKLQTSKQKLYLSLCFCLAQLCFLCLNPFWLNANEYRALTKRRFKFVSSVLNV